MKPETNRVEYKSMLDDVKDEKYRFEREVVAFLNYPGGGHIYVGIDKNNKPIGMTDIDQTQLQIKDRIMNNIEPHTLGLFDVVVEKVDKISVIHVVISGGMEMPYYIKKYGMTPKGCHIRVGSSVESMPQKMIDRLYAERVRLTLKEIPAGKRDQTFEQLKIYYGEKGKKLDDSTFKKTLDLLMEDGRDNFVSYLLSDENSISIKVAKYAGTSKVDLIENDEYGYCCLVKACKSVLHRMEIENKTFAKITYHKRLERKLVDGTALKEAIINAIVHTDYTHNSPPIFEIFSDRIVITSYGGLVKGLSREEFFKGCSMVRNRELMRVFRDLDLVEQLGSGMKRIMEVYDESNFEFTEHFMFVTFPFAKGFEENNTTNNVVLNVVLNKTEKQIFEILCENNNETAETLATTLDIAERTAQRNLKSLQEKGLIKRIGSKKTGYWEVITD